MKHALAILLLLCCALTAANFWVCQAGSTSYYDFATSTNVLTLDFNAP